MSRGPRHSDFAPPRAERKVVCDAVTEWDDPIAGYGATSRSIAMTMQHDPGGQIWIELSVGEETVLLRPETAKEFGSMLWSTSARWRDCHWNLELDACVSQTCQYRPGGSHIGRLRDWERTRNRRVVGADRDPEILRLHEAGMSRRAIAQRVGWSESTVGRVIRESIGNERSEDFA